MGHKVEVMPAHASQKTAIENLIQLYLYDMAAQSTFPVNNLGKYDYDFLDRFWEHPYLIYFNGEIAGFCLVISHSPITQRRPCWFMAEFCVLRPYQRKGVGTYAIGDILQRHKGDWEISWLPSNGPAAAFWPNVIPNHTGRPKQVEFDDMTWNSVSFISDVAS